MFSRRRIVVKPIKDNRRKNAARKKLQPKPCWVQAYMIFLLHENAMLKQKLTGKPQVAQISMPLASLKRFEELKGDNKTILTYDVVAETVTITAPEAILPEEPKIIVNKGIVTQNKN